MAVFRNSITIASKSLTLIALVALFIFHPLAAHSAGNDLQEVSRDNPVVDFTLPDVRNSDHALADYRGKVVLVNFWASWCPPCITEMPELTALKKHYADKPFEILALNVGEKRYRVRKFVKLVNFGLPVLLDIDSEIFDSWGVQTLPTSFLVDTQGHIRYRIRGNPGWELEQTRAVIDKLIAEPAKTAKPDPAAGTGPGHE